MREQVDRFIERVGVLRTAFVLALELLKMDKETNTVLNDFDAAWESFKPIVEKMKCIQDSPASTHPPEQSTHSATAESAAANRLLIPNDPTHRIAQRSIGASEISDPLNGGTVTTDGRSETSAPGVTTNANTIDPSPTTTPTTNEEPSSSTTSKPTTTRRRRYSDYWLKRLGDSRIKSTCPCETQGQGHFIVGIKDGDSDLTIACATIIDRPTGRLFRCWLRVHRKASGKVAAVVSVLGKTAASDREVGAVMGVQEELG